MLGLCTCRWTVFTVTSYSTCSVNVPAAANNKVPAKVLISYAPLQDMVVFVWQSLLGASFATPVTRENMFFHPRDKFRLLFKL